MAARKVTIMSKKKKKSKSLSVVFSKPVSLLSPSGSAPKAIS